MKVCGIDEAGRGPLAGPLVGVGVILGKPVEGLNDSKKLTAIQREKLLNQLIQSDAEIQIEVISVRLINTRGIGWANKEIFRRIIKKLEASKYIVDGNLKLGIIKGKKGKIKALIKADSTRKCVMAASIVAKETRDKIMRDLDSLYPIYKWKTNAGYGTKYHIETIRNYGMVKYHRLKFVETALKNKNATYSNNE